MNDEGILSLFWERKQEALSEADRRYGGYCRAVSYRILRNHEDAEECVNDAYLRAWNAIPPERPERLAVYLGKITRNLSLDRLRKKNAQKRGAGELPLVLSELSECLPSGESAEDSLEEKELTALLDRFLGELPSESRIIFIRRYWYLSSIREIAASLGFGESRVKMSLLRARGELRNLLEKEGVTL